jgi:threonylcarbamoyladenosine tRNA methylthiotransferase MtaB
MHIVLQSGSNVILKRMNRKYTRQIFMETADRLRNASSDFTFTTDVIVGFPGETDADFAETLAVIEEVKFAKVHMFPFSPRPRTRAALMPNKVPQEVIKDRKQQVLHLAEKTTYRLQESYLGRKMTVLTEGVESGKEDLIHGHTDNFLKVSMPQGNWKANQLLEVEIYKNTPTGLKGHVIRNCDG